MSYLSIEATRTRVASRSIRACATVSRRIRGRAVEATGAIIPVVRHSTGARCWKQFSPRDGARLPGGIESEPGTRRPAIRGGRGSGCRIGSSEAPFAPDLRRVVTMRPRGLLPRGPVRSRSDGDFARGTATSRSNTESETRSPTRGRARRCDASRRRWTRAIQKPPSGNTPTAVGRAVGPPVVSTSTSDGADGLVPSNRFHVAPVTGAVG